MERAETVKPSASRRVLVFGFTVLLLGAAAVALLYRTVPKGDAGDGPVDALVVLGTPAGLHGEINPMQVWRVDEAVREFRAGRAPRILFAGGAAGNPGRGDLAGAAIAYNAGEHLQQRGDCPGAWLGVGGGDQLAAALAAGV